MASVEQAQEHSDWRARQKERERERRRMRDRQRRQSMSVEEREKHLARRRKNYQLRRQRAATATAQFSFDQTSMSSSKNLGGTAHVESETLNCDDNNLAIVCISDVHLQSKCAMQDNEFSEVYENEEEGASAEITYDGDGGETKFHAPYKYPRLPRLNQIRKLARSLNAASAVDAELIDPHSVVESRVRLIHIKHLARALNSNVGKTLEQTLLDYDSGQENTDARMTDQMTSEAGAYWDVAVQ